MCWGEHRVYKCDLKYRSPCCSHRLPVGLNVCEIRSSRFKGRLTTSRSIQETTYSKIPWETRGCRGAQSHPWVSSEKRRAPREADAPGGGRAAVRAKRPPLLGSKERKGYQQSMSGDDGLVFVTNYSPSPAAEASRARSQRWCWAHVWGWQWCACSRTIFSQTDNPYYCSGVYCFQQGNPGCKPARINYSLLSQSTFQTAIIFLMLGEVSFHCQRWPHSTAISQIL